MKRGFLNLLKGKFLVSDDASKNWMYIVFASILAAVMIASAHSADRKVHRVAALNEAVRELRSEFVDTRSDVQQLRLESTIRGYVEEDGLGPSATPPRKILVKTTTK